MGCANWPGIPVSVFFRGRRGRGGMSREEADNIIRGNYIILGVLFLGPPIVLPLMGLVALHWEVTASAPVPVPMQVKEVQYSSKYRRWNVYARDEEQGQCLVFHATNKPTVAAGQTMTVMRRVVIKESPWWGEWTTYRYAWNGEEGQ